jgi:hypothetical protein
MSRTAQVIITRYSPALISIVAGFSAMSGKADDNIPPRFNFDRYSAMVDHSPFAIATALALPTATPDFAKDLYVANAARSPEGDMVTIASSSDQNFKKYLTTRGPVDGYSIASIEWSDRIGATKVTISNDGKFATLTFNQALLSQRAAPNVPPALDQLPQSMPPMPSFSVPIRAPGDHVPAKNQQKPGAAAVSPQNPQQQLQLQQQRRQREEKLEKWRKQKADSQGR